MSYLRISRVNIAKTLQKAFKLHIIYAQGHLWVDLESFCLYLTNECNKIPRFHDRGLTEAELREKYYYILSYITEKRDIRSIYRILFTHKSYSQLFRGFHPATVKNILTIYERFGLCDRAEKIYKITPMGKSFLKLIRYQSANVKTTHTLYL